jgi:glycosyltransferase involved in cell wall biosynthesis
LVGNIKLWLNPLSTRPNHRELGDAARDAKDWPSAETAYENHLRSTPEDMAIWVQYGHSLKEQGKLIDAEAAYRRAIDLIPNDADAHLQLGHLLKAQGKLIDAERAYALSMEIAPSKAAFDELMRLGSAAADGAANADASLDSRNDAIYLEVDDLLDYLRNHRTLSGIQRVQAGVIEYALGQIASDKLDCAFVRTGKYGTGFWRIGPTDLRAIIDYVGQAVVSQERLLSLIEGAEQRALRTEPGKGQTYFVLGAFWGFGSNAARYANLKSAGVSIGAYIYDLIPITHPEYCSAGLVSEFTLALGDGLFSFDFVLTISEFVASEVRKFLKRHDLREVPVQSVTLAHQLHHRPKGISTSIWSRAIALFETRPFVLMVSTIEARKNHIYLYAVWKALIDQGLEPPDLVFVGRFGWRVNDLRDMLEGTGFLGNRIHLLHDLSDIDLELLYRSCLFTAFPSLVEGWGLPVGESLAHGRPSVASNSSSIPEVGGEFVDYIDPWNVNDGIRVFKRMIFDEAYRASRTKNIEKNFVARTWNDVGRDLFDCLRRFHGRTQAVFVPPRLAPGELLMPGEMSVGRPVPANYPSRPLRPIIADSWFPAEPFGAWLRGNSGFLWFSSDCKPGTRIYAYLHLVGAPWSIAHTITLAMGRTAQQGNRRITFPASVGAERDRFHVKANENFVCSVSGTVDSDGTVFITLTVDGEMVSAHPGKDVDDDRIFYAGLVKMSYAAVSDMQLRLDMMERFLRLDGKLEDRA